MKSFLVIGMGRFGSYLAYKLAELKNEVVIADRNAATVERMAPDFTDAHIADCTDPVILKSMGVDRYDACVVCVGENFQSSLEITYNLKELGAKYIVSKSNKDNQAKFLRKIGADEVVYPEKEMAEKVAVRFSSGRNILDFIPLTSDYAVFEIPVPPVWVGCTVAEVNVRRKYNLNVLAVKNSGKINPSPCAETVFDDGDVLIIFGAENDVMKLPRKPQPKE